MDFFLASSAEPDEILPNVWHFKPCGISRVKSTRLPVSRMKKVICQTH